MNQYIYDNSNNFFLEKSDPDIIYLFNSIHLLKKSTTQVNALVGDLDALRPIGKKTTRIYHGLDYHKASMSKYIDIILLDDMPKNKKKALLNQVYCKQMKENDIDYAISLSLFIKHPHLLPIMRKNLVICKKFKIKTILSPFSKDVHHIRSEKDTHSLIKILTN